MTYVSQTYVIFIRLQLCRAFFQCRRIHAMLHTRTSPPRVVLGPMLQRFPLLLLAAVANARVLGHSVVPHVGAPPTSRRRRRQQQPGCIFSAALPGFDPPGQPHVWPHVWRAPSSQPGPNKKKKYIYEAEVESSVHPGTFQKVRVEYARRGEKAILPGFPSNKEVFGPIVR